MAKQRPSVARHEIGLLVNLWPGASGIAEPCTKAEAEPPGAGLAALALAFAQAFAVVGSSSATGARACPARPLVAGADADRGGILCASNRAYDLTLLVARLKVEKELLARGCILGKLGGPARASIKGRFGRHLARPKFCIFPCAEVHDHLFGRKRAVGHAAQFGRRARLRHIRGRTTELPCRRRGRLGRFGNRRRRLGLHLGACPFEQFIHLRGVQILVGYVVRP